LVVKTHIDGKDSSESDNGVECVAICRESSGVFKVRVFFSVFMFNVHNTLLVLAMQLMCLDDTYVWTATSNSSINRWVCIDSPRFNSIFDSFEIILTIFFFF